MSGEELSRALGDISEEKIQDALIVYERKRKIRNIWLRVISVAAVLAIILGVLLWPGSEEGFVTAPGVLKVYGYDLTKGALDETTCYELEEGKGVYSVTAWSMGMNLFYGLPIRFEVEEGSFEDCDITFDVKVDLGHFYEDYRKYPEYVGVNAVQWTLDDIDLGNEFSISNNELILWDYLYSGFDESDIEENENALESYVEVIVKADENVVGYALIQICCVSQNSNLFAAQVCKAVIYPKVNGKFQNITEEYVLQKIRAMKNDG